MQVRQPEAAARTPSRPEQRTRRRSAATDRLVFDPSWLGDAPPSARPLLMFDGGCPFCRAAARLVARVDRDGRLALLSRDDEAAAPYAARIPRAGLPRRGSSSSRPA